MGAEQKRTTPFFFSRRYELLAIQPLWTSRIPPQPLNPEFYRRTEIQMKFPLVAAIGPVPEGPGLGLAGPVLLTAAGSWGAATAS